VLRDGAFAAASLDAELTRTPQVAGRDAALATELVFGALRMRSWLEPRIERHVKRGFGSVDELVRVHLLLGAYQLFFLDRVPAFAVVSEGVDLVRHVQGPRVAGFVNAVLRRLAEDARAFRQAGTAGKQQALSEAFPQWLRRQLEESLGEVQASAFVDGCAVVPPTVLRVRTSGADVEAARDQWLDRLRAARPDGTFEPGQLVRAAILARAAGPVTGLPGYDTRELVVHEEGSQVIAAALGVGPGERVLDACAGRGHKTAALADAVGPTGQVDACDLHASKLEHLKEEHGRLGLPPPATYAVDWTAGTADVPSGYDAVLVDAPCSGVGTLRRRPEILVRRRPEDIAASQTLQQAVLRAAATRVRPGGRLVYAVCSVLRDEGEAVVDAFLAAHPDFQRGVLALPAALGSAWATRLLPAVHGTDGYFLAALQRSTGLPG
jgi:16S rRNA (cytosine967-C5)-methyltransferase